MTKDEGLVRFQLHVCGCSVLAEAQIFVRENNGTVFFVLLGNVLLAYIWRDNLLTPSLNMLFWGLSRAAQPFLPIPQIFAETRMP